MSEPKQPTGTPDSIDWEEVDRISAEKRRLSRERTQAAISAVMRDTSGLERLEAITDEEWAKVQAVDDAIEAAEREARATQQDLSGAPQQVGSNAS